MQRANFSLKQASSPIRGGLGGGGFRTPRTLSLDSPLLSDLICWFYAGVIN